MIAVVGLGNIGNGFKNTYHNMGFMVADELAKRLNVKFDIDKCKASIAKTEYEGEEVLIVKPKTYMNNSGFALRQCLDFYKVGMENVIVIYDDVDLPVGKLRLRQKGSAGGHNGIKSIISCGFSNEFDRIRVGVGKDPKIPMIEWVLSKFRETEKEELDQGIENAALAAYYSIDHSFDKTMNSFNKK